MWACSGSFVQAIWRVCGTAATSLRFGEELQNFSDTAALIENLDLVISVDTSVAHLAGALAKPVWILLPYQSGLALAARSRRQPLVSDGAAVSAGPLMRLGRRHAVQVQAELQDYVRGV